MFTCINKYHGAVPNIKRNEHDNFVPGGYGTAHDAD